MMLYGVAGEKRIAGGAITVPDFIHEAPLFVGDSKVWAIVRFQQKKTIAMEPEIPDYVSP